MCSFSFTAVTTSCVAAAIMGCRRNPDHVSGCSAGHRLHQAPRHHSVCASPERSTSSTAAHASRYVDKHSLLTSCHKHPGTAARLDASPGTAACQAARQRAGGGDRPKPRAAHVAGHHVAAVADDREHQVRRAHDLGRDRARQARAHGGQRVVNKQRVGRVRRELPREPHLRARRAGSDRACARAPCALAALFGETVCLSRGALLGGTGSPPRQRGRCNAGRTPLSRALHQRKAVSTEEAASM